MNNNEQQPAPILQKIMDYAREEYESERLYHIEKQIDKLLSKLETIEEKFAANTNEIVTTK